MRARTGDVHVFLFLPFTTGDWLTVASNLNLTKINISSPERLSHTQKHTHTPQVPHGKRWNKTNMQPTLVKVLFL